MQSHQSLVTKVKEVDNISIILVDEDSYMNHMISLGSVNSPTKGRQNKHQETIYKLYPNSTPSQHGNKQTHYKLNHSP